MVQYLIRLDDLCPTNNFKKWDRFFKLFDLYGIKPIIAVIPCNKDPKLIACGNPNLRYWPLVRQLQKKDYLIAMHGFEHCYQTNNSGFFKQNTRSEFAGLTLTLQEQKVKAAVAIFNKEKVNTPIFVAPAHSFDRNTIKALIKYSNIKVISDGLLKLPYLRFGLKWVPVQLSEVCFRKNGTWTFSYHPETCTDAMFIKLQSFIEKHHQHFVCFVELSFKNYTWKYYFIEQYYIYRRLIFDNLKKQILYFKT